MFNPCLPNFIQSFSGINIRNNRFMSSADGNFILQVRNHWLRLMLISHESVYGFEFIWDHCSDNSRSRSLNGFNSFNCFTFLFIRNLLIVTVDRIYFAKSYLGVDKFGSFILHIGHFPGFNFIGALFGIVENPSLKTFY